MLMNNHHSLRSVKPLLVACVLMLWSISPVMARIGGERCGSRHGAFLESVGSYETYVFSGAPGLASGAYIVKRHEVRLIFPFDEEGERLIPGVGSGSFTESKWFHWSGTREVSGDCSSGWYRVGRDIWKSSGDGGVSDHRWKNEWNNHDGRVLIDWYRDWWGDPVTIKYEIKEASAKGPYFVELGGPPNIWTAAWGPQNPNDGSDWAEVLSYNAEWCEIKTFVYEVWDIAGHYLGFHPGRPGDVGISFYAWGYRNWDPPVLDSPAQAVTTNRTITVSGWRAPTNSPVDLYDNDHKQPTVWSDDYGRFSGAVTLDEGENRITATATGRTGIPSDHSEPIFVKYLPPGPGPPQLVSPADGSWVNTSTVTLEWQPAKGDDPQRYLCYDIEVSTSPDFSTLLYDQGMCDCRDYFTDPGLEVLPDHGYDETGYYPLARSVEDTKDFYQEFDMTFVSPPLYYGWVRVGLENSDPDNTSLLEVGDFYKGDDGKRRFSLRFIDQNGEETWARQVMPDFVTGRRYHLRISYDNKKDELTASMWDGTALVASVVLEQVDGFEFDRVRFSVRPDRPISDISWSASQHAIHLWGDADTAPGRREIETYVDNMRVVTGGNQPQVPPLTNAAVTVPEGTVFWRVQSVDLLGRESDWVCSGFSVDVTPPVADAGTDFSVPVNTTITFDGTASYDPKPGSGISSWRWGFLEGGAPVTLHGEITSFCFRHPSSYVVRLVVEDVAGNVTSDTLHVAVGGSGTYPSAWPSARYDMERTGWCCNASGESLRELWAIDGIWEHIVIGTQGRVYGCSGRYLSAIDPGSQQVIWRFEGDGDLLPPVIGSDGRVYVVSDIGTLSAIMETVDDPNPFKVEWEYSMDGRALTSPVVRSDGRIYLHVDNVFHALRDEGDRVSVVWEKLFPARPDGLFLAAAAGNTEAVYVVSQEYASPGFWRLSKFVDESPNHQVWSVGLGQANDISYPVVGDAGDVYLSLNRTDGSWLIRFSKDNGSQVWIQNLGQVASAAAVGPAGRLYVQGTDAGGVGNLICVDSNDGTKVWNYEYQWILSSCLPTVDRSGNILCLAYFGDSGQLLKFADAGLSGRVIGMASLWQVGFRADSSPVVSNEGMVYLTGGSALHCVGPDPEEVSVSVDGLVEVNEPGITIERLFSLPADALNALQVQNLEEPQWIYDVSFTPSAAVWTFKYDPSAVVGDEQSLRVYHYEEMEWAELPGQQIDTAANWITCTLESASLFVITRPGDSLPPRTEIQFLGPSVGAKPVFISSATAIMFTAIDDRYEVGDSEGLGVLFTEYRIDSGDWQVYEVTFTLTAGYHRIEYRSKDKAGNLEEIKRTDVFQDEEAPRIDVEVGYPKVTTLEYEYITSTTTIEISADDYGGSGVESVLYQIDAEDLHSYSTPIQMDTEGKHILTIIAQDKVGNARREERVFCVDNTPPEVTLEVNGPEYQTADMYYVLSETEFVLFSEDPAIKSEFHDDFLLDISTWVVESGRWWWESYSACGTEGKLVSKKEFVHERKVKARMRTEKSGTNSWEVSWIYPLYHNWANCMYALLHKTGEIELTIVKDGERSEYRTPSSLSPFDWHEFMFEIGGDDWLEEKQVVLYIDGEKYLKVDDEKIAELSGHVAFDANDGAQAEIKWVKVIWGEAPGCGVLMTKKQIDDKSWQDYEGVFTLEIAGHHTVSYFAEDRLGNKSQEEKEEFVLDDLWPATEIVESYQQGTWKHITDERIYVPESASYALSAEDEDIGWNEYTENFCADIAGWTPESGSWKVQEGTYEGIQGKSVRYTDYPHDRIVEGLVKTESSGTNSWEVGWIYGKYESWDNCCYALLHKDGKVEVTVLKGGERRNYEVQSDLSPLLWHRFTFKVEASTLTFSIDQKEYVKVIDDRLPLLSGGIALDANASRVLFDNIRVAEIRDVAIYSGIDKTQYRIDSGIWQEWDKESEQIQFSEGIRTIEYRSTDRVENEEPTRATTYYVDGTAPGSMLTLEDGAQYESENGTLYASQDTQYLLTAEDHEVVGVRSGIREILVRMDEGEYEQYTSIITLTEGIHTIGWYSVDNVGNTENPQTFTVSVDTTTPETELVIGEPSFDGFGYKFISPQTPLVLNAEDPVSNSVSSGLKYTEYRLNEGEWIIYTGTFSFPSGQYLFEYRSRDNVENTEETKSVQLAVTVLEECAVFASTCVKLNGNGFVKGHVYSNTLIEVVGKAVVDGDAVAQEIKVTGNAEVRGQTKEESPGFPDEPIDVSIISLMVQETNDNDKIPLTQLGRESVDPDGVLTLEDDDVLVLSTGTYYLTGLYISDSATLEAEGTVRILIDGVLEITGQGNLTSSGIPWNSFVISSTDTVVKVSGQGKYEGLIYAPRAEVQVSGNGMVMIGNVFAREAHIAGNAQVIAPQRESGLPVRSAKRDTPKNSPDPDSDFYLRAYYIYPNPAKSGASPTIHLECGIADRVEIRIYNIAGELVHDKTITGSPFIKSDKYVYEHSWDVTDIASGVYISVIDAHKQGEDPIREIKKLAVIK